MWTVKRRIDYRIICRLPTRSPGPVISPGSAWATTLTTKDVLPLMRRMQSSCACLNILESCLSVQPGYQHQLPVNAPASWPTEILLLERLTVRYLRWSGLSCLIPRHLKRLYAIGEGSAIMTAAFLPPRQSPGRWHSVKAAASV